MNIHKYITGSPEHSGLVLSQEQLKELRKWLINDAAQIGKLSAEAIDMAMDEYAVSHDQEYETPSKYSNAPLPKDVEIVNVQVFYDIEVTYKVAGAEDFMLLESSMDLADQGGPASKAAAQFIRRWPHEKIVDLITGHDEEEAADPTLPPELTEFDKELLDRARGLWTDEDEAEAVLLGVSQQGPSELDVDVYLAAHDLKADKRSLCTGHPREDATFQNLLSELAAAVEIAPYGSRQRIKAQELLLLTLRAGPQNK